MDEHGKCGRAQKPDRPIRYNKVVYEIVKKLEEMIEAIV
jgi:hypothetical protein